MPAFVKFDNAQHVSSYRKRFDEIKRAGILLNERLIENGCKKWSLPDSEKEKAREVLSKCK